MPRAATKPDRVDVVPSEPIEGPVIWFEFSEGDARLLAKGIVSARVREMAASCVAWCDDDPSGFVDRSHSAVHSNGVRGR